MKNNDLAVDDQCQTIVTVKVNLQEVSLRSFFFVEACNDNNLMIRL